MAVAIGLEGMSKADLDALSAILADARSNGASLRQICQMADDICGSERILSGSDIAKLLARAGER